MKTSENVFTGSWGAFTTIIGTGTWGTFTAIIQSVCLMLLVCRCSLFIPGQILSTVDVDWFCCATGWLAGSFSHEFQKEERETCELKTMDMQMCQ